MTREHGRTKIPLDLTNGWAKGGYAVPCDLLAEVLEAHKAELREEDLFPEANNCDRDDGWKMRLAGRAAQMTGRTPEAVFRRLYDVLHGKTRAVNIDMAEGMLLAVGLYLDHDTDLPTLPVSRSAAKDMAEVNCEDWTPEEQASLAKSLLHFAQGFILHDYAVPTLEEVLIEGLVEVSEEELIAA